MWRCKTGMLAYIHWLFLASCDGLFRGDFGRVHWWYHALQGPGTSHWPSRNACRTETIRCSSAKLFIFVLRDLATVFRIVSSICGSYWQNQTNRDQLCLLFAYVQLSGDNSMVKACGENFRWFETFVVFCFLNIEYLFIWIDQCVKMDVENCSFLMSRL